MQIDRLSIEGAARVRIERLEDHRGFFARTFCTTEFAAHGLSPSIVQASVSYNAKRGTVRGLHFQWPPSKEDKVVRCVRGSIFDVLVDLRPESASYLQCETLMLDAESYDAVFIPHGVAHGFQTLEDNSEVLYLMSDFYEPALAAGVLWDDPAFGIRWPLAEVVISDRDRACPRFDAALHARSYKRLSDEAAAAGRIEEQR